MGSNQEIEVVISGLSFKLPGITSLHEFSEKLNSSTPIVPPCKKTFREEFSGYDDVPENNRLMDNVDALDYTFSGLTKSVGDNCGATTRNLMELSYEALLDAGVCPKEVKNILCSVYQSTMMSESEMGLFPKRNKGNYYVTRFARCMEANRVSFFLNASGSSISTDGGFVSGLRVIQNAYRDIQTGRADMAIVCGSNLAVHLQSTLHYHHLGAISSDDHTRVFDNDANGYVRSMAVMSMVLQRASEAKRVYAKIRHVEFRQEPDLSVQKTESWEKMYKQFYKRASIPIQDISYMEPYCCGIKDMDSAELNAMANVMCENRKTPLLIGSIKSNLGHTEGCADYLSILKAISMFETGVIPANQSYCTPNSQVPGLSNGLLKVVNKSLPLPGDLVAISGWHFGGCYGHLVLERISKVKKECPIFDIPRLVPISARTDEYIRPNIDLLESIPYDPELYQLITDVFKRPSNKNLGRGYAIMRQNNKTICSISSLDEETKRPVWFMFSGMGSQWVGMGTQLMKIPLIRESLEKSHRILKEKGMDLIDILTTDDPHVFDNILYAFVGISAIQIALVDLMRALNVVPDGMIGHSLGEQSCAYASGCLTAEQTILAAYYRGSASLAVPLIKGMMAAIGMGYNQIKDELPEGVEVACHNSNSSCTLSGPANIIEKYVNQLTERKVFARTVNVGNVAYHSTHVKPAANYVYTSLKEVIPEPNLRPSCWISTSVPEDRWDSALAQYCSAEYLTNNLTSSVLFEEGCKHVPENAILIEFAPHGLLQAIVKRSMKNAIHLSLTNRTAGDSVNFLLESLGRMYQIGMELDINVLYPGVEYPVSRGTYNLPPFVHWIRYVGRLNDIDCGNNFNINLRHSLAAVDPSMAGIKIANQQTFPLSAFVHLMERQLHRYRLKLTDEPLLFVDLRFEENLDLSIQHDEWLEEGFCRESGLSELTSKNGKFVASGFLNVVDQVDTSPQPVPTSEYLVTIPKQELYEWFSKRGLEVPSSLHALNYITITKQGLVSSISSKHSMSVRIEAFLQIFMFEEMSRGKSIVFPNVIREIRIDNSLQVDTNELEIVYDRAMRSVTCPGLSMSDVLFKPIYPLSIPYHSFHSISKVSIKNPNLKTNAEFVSFCSNLVENGRSKFGNVTVVDLLLESAHLTSHLKQNNNLIEITKVSSVEDEDIDVAAYGLVLCGKHQLPQVVNSAKNFILVQGSGTLNIPNNFVIVSTYKADNEHQLWLVKKKIIVNGERDFIVIPEKKEDLVATLLARGNHTCLVVGYQEPAEGLLRYLKSVQSQVNTVIRWMLILDADAPRFSASNPLYRQQLEIGLSINVLLKGEWYYILKTRIGVLDNESISTYTQETYSCGVIQLESKQLMGIRNATSADGLDDVLKWPVPKSWSEADVLSLPTAYSLAYYCFKVIYQTTTFDNVLVTDGLSDFGQAAITVALTIAGRVFASVASKEEAAQLMALFPKIKPDDIIIHSDKHFALRLRHATGESHPEVIYNLLDGEKFKNCLETINKFGKMFHLGQEDIKRNTAVGMATFLKSVSLCCVSPEAMHKWSDDDKKQVYQLVSDGISSGVVRPRQLREQMKKYSFDCNRAQKPAGQRNNLITLNSSSTYVVVGEASNKDLDIAEWLVRSGVKNIAICNPIYKNNPDYQRKIKALEINRNVNIQTLDQHSLKKQIKNINAHAIFFINMATDSTNNQLTLFNDVLTPELKNVVTISRGMDYVIKMVKMAVEPASYTNIVWESTEDHFLEQSLDILAPYLGSLPSITVAHNLLQQHSQYAYNLLKESLPDSPEKYLNLGQSLKAEPELVYLRPIGVPNDWRKTEVTPLIVLPGLQDDPVEIASQLVKDLLIPAYAAVTPATGFKSVESMASSLVQVIKSKLHRKTYNLAGVSSGCALALEVTRQLEAQGHIVYVVLFDNTLTSLQKGLRTEEELQTAFLDVLSSLSTEESYNVKLKSLPWSDRLNHVLTSCGYKQEDIKRAVGYIYDNLKALLNYNISDITAKGPLSIVRSSDSNDDCNYNSMCLNNLIVDVDVPRKLLLQSEDVRKIADQIISHEDINPMIAHEVHWKELVDLLKWERTLTA